MLETHVLNFLLLIPAVTTALLFFVPANNRLAPRVLSVGPVR